MRSTWQYRLVVSNSKNRCKVHIIYLYSGKFECRYDICCTPVIILCRYRRRTANASESYCVYFHRGLAESRPCSSTYVIMQQVDIAAITYRLFWFIFFFCEPKPLYRYIRYNTCCIARGESTVIFDFSAYSTKKSVYMYLIYTAQITFISGIIIIIIISF